MILEEFFGPFTHPHVSPSYISSLYVSWDEQYLWCCLHWEHLWGILVWNNDIAGIHLFQRKSSGSCTIQTLGNGDILPILQVHNLRLIMIIFLKDWISMIILLRILDSLQVAFMTQGVYQYLVFGRDTANVPWTILSQVITTVLSDSIVRCIFTRRIWFLSDRKKVLLFFLLSTSFLVFATGMAFAIRGFLEVSYAKLVVESSWLLYTSLGGAVFADLLIALSLCILLDHSRSGFTASDSLVNTLMMYSINTGILTSVCATCCFVTFTIWPHSFIFIGIYFVLGKLYVNTILAVLNTRAFLRARNPGVTTIPQSPSAIEPLSFLPTLSNANDTIERPRPLKLAFQCKTTLQQHPGS